MFTYDLTALSASGGRPILRFANSPQTLSFLLVGELDETTDHYVAAVGIGVQVQDGHTILSTDAVTVTLQDGYSTPTYLVEVLFDDYTEEYFNAVNGIVGGKTLIFTLRGMDETEKETDYACFEITGIQSPNPPGYTPPPNATRPGTTVNGLYGAVKLVDSAGADLPASGNSIPITKAIVGLPNVQNILDNLNATAAPTATDDSSKGYSKKSQWIYDGRFYTCVDPTAGAAVWTEGGGGDGDVTAAGNNTFGGVNVFEQSLTVGGNLVDGLHCDDNPLDAYQAYDVNLRPYTWLDGTAASPKLTFKNYLLNLMEITFLAKSENAESSGNARLVAKRPDGTEVARFTVAVTPTATLRTLPFDNFTGALEITRDTTDALDTLPGAIKIYALSTWRAK